MNSGFSRSLIGQIDWHFIYELVEALPLIYYYYYFFNITLIYLTWLSQLLFFFLPSVNLIETAKNKKNKTKQYNTKKNSYFSVQNFKPLTDKVEMEQFKGAAIYLSASNKFCE